MKTENLVHFQCVREILDVIVCEAIGIVIGEGLMGIHQLI